jgi:hypothetical protein
MWDLVDRKGQLTDAGLEIARFLEQSGNYAHLAPPPSASEPLSAEKALLIAELRLLAQKAGGLAALRRLLDGALARPWSPVDP